MLSHAEAHVEVLTAHRGVFRPRPLTPCGEREHPWRRVRPPARLGRGPLTAAPATTPATRPNWRSTSTPQPTHGGMNQATRGPVGAARRARRQLRKTVA